MTRFPWRVAAALCCSSSLLAHAADTRAEFLKLIDHTPAPLAVQITELPVTNGMEQFHFSFAADANQRVPGLLIKSDASQGRRPVVIVLHGTGGTKEGMRSWLQRLAKEGFIAVAIDGRYHGERTQAGEGAAEYEIAALQAWRGSGEHPFFYDTVWDVMRLVDYLETRADVDPQRIGLMGISKGGIETYLTAAVDPRIAVAVPCIGVQSFHWALDNNLWQSRMGTIQSAFDGAAKDAGVSEPGAPFARKFYDRVAPGIYGEFDGPAMVPLIAPRPLLMINGDSDDRTPMPGLRECIDPTQEAYRAADAEDCFAVRIQENTGHTVTSASERVAIEWFVRWLEP